MRVNSRSTSDSALWPRHAAKHRVRFSFPPIALLIVAVFSHYLARGRRRSLACRPQYLLILLFAPNLDGAGSGHRTRGVANGRFEGHKAEGHSLDASGSGMHIELS